MKLFTYTKYSIVLVHLAMFCATFFAVGVQGQCTFTSVEFDSFEYNTICPNLISGTVYHLSPESYAAHTGTRSIYMNFVDNLAANTLVYSRQYTVCPNHSYRLNSWFVQTFGGISTIILRIKDGTGTILTSSVHTYSASTWAQWTSGVITPTTGTITFELIYSSGIGNNDLSMDDLDLELCVPPIIAGPPITVCSSASAINLLDSLAKPIGTTGTWSGPSSLLNASLGTFNPATMAVGLYTYTISGSPTACPDSVWTVNVAIKSSPSVSLGNDTIICTGDDFWLGPIQTTADSVFWNGNLVADSLKITQTGNYFVKVVGGGCTYYDSIYIEVINLSQIEIQIPESVCLGDDFTLWVPDQKYATYLWSTGETDSEIVVKEAGNYSLTLSHPCGTITKSIDVVFEKCACNFYLPTAFSPNGDGINDEFYPVYECSIRNYFISIVDRWGHEVFYSNNPTERWDGLNAHLGVFIVHVFYQGVNEEGQTVGDNFLQTLTIIN